MKLKIEIELDNAVFNSEGDPAGEIASLLDDCSGTVADSCLLGKVKPFAPRTLRDSNGNEVGFVEITPD